MDIFLDKKEVKMGSVISWLDGKKTYAFLLGYLVVVGLEMGGVFVVPPGLKEFLLVGAGLSGRASLSKILKK